MALEGPEAAERQEAYMVEVTKMNLVSPDYEHSPAFGIPHPNAPDAAVREWLRAPSTSATQRSRDLIELAGARLARGLNAIRVDSQIEPLLVRLPPITDEPRDSMWR
jgi:hypothetical protein